MVDPTNRLALRRGLPWTFFGFVALLASVGVWVGAFLFDLDASGDLLANVVLAARLVGLLGAALFAFGLSAFLRARASSAGARWLDAALVLWLGELGLRVAWMVSDRLVESTLGLRALLAAGAALCLASWMARVWRDEPSARVYVSWSVTRALFLLQLAALLWMAAIPGTTETAFGRFLLPVLWLGFVVPWAVLWMALRRTMREVARQTTVGDLLTS